MNTSRLCDLRAFAPLLFAGLLVVTPLSARGQFAGVLNTNSRYAGSSTATNLYSGDTGSASSTSLNAPSYAVFDSTGNLYVSDTANNCVRRIDTSGNITTVAGLRVSGAPDTCNTLANPTPAAAQGLLHPTGLAIDSANTLYIADSQHNCVRSLPGGTLDSFAANALTTVAGTCSSLDTASATPVPNGLALDSNGSLYISIQDAAAPIPVNQVLRHRSADPATTVCYVAGQPSANVPNACAGVSGTVTLSHPAGLAFDVNGNLFLADTGNNCVREIAGLATQQTAVGQCANDHFGSSATTLESPYGLAFSPTASLYISESAANTNNVVSFAPGSGTLTLVAGLPSGAPGLYSSLLDGQSSLNAPLNAPLGLTTDATGNLYLADSQNNVLRELSTGLFFPPTSLGASSQTQTVTFAINHSVTLTATAGADYTIVGTTCSGPMSSPNTCQATVRFTPSRAGTRSSALQLKDLASNETVNVPLTGIGTGALSLFTPGMASTSAKGLRTPIAVSVDAAGDAYVLEQGNASTTADVLLIPAGGGSPQTLVAPGTGLVTPTAMAVDGASNVFITDAALAGVTRFGADGSVNTTYVTGLVDATAIAVDQQGNLYIAQSGSAHNVIEVYASGTRRVLAGSGTTANADGAPAANALFVAPSSLALGPNGLSVADASAHLVYTIDGAGIIHIVAGNGTTATSIPGQATGTGLLLPVGLATDAAGDLYVSDEAANRIYEIYPVASNGVNISGPLGTGASGYTGDGNFATAATLTAPVAIGLDGSGDLFAVDAGNGALREVTYPVTANINFGNTIIGTTSSAVLQSLTNAGNATLTFAAPFATTDSHYAVSTDPASTTCGTSIAAGTVCTIGYTFTPTVLGPLPGQSILTSNSYNTPQTVELNAYGLFTQALPYSLAPETEAFGQPFIETAILSTVYPDLVPTGTMAFTIAGETTCSTSGTFPSSVNCAAPASGLGIGTYVVNFTYTSGDVSYRSTTGTTTLTVTSGTLAVTPANVSKPYGAPIPALPAIVTGASSGDIFLASDTTTATAASPVGTYPITPTLTQVGLANLNNYAVTYNTGTLTVTPVPLNVTIGSVTRAYGTANPAFSNTIAGAVNGDTFTVTYSTSATPTSPVGAYPITATITGTNLGNYILAVVPGTLTITPVPLTVTVANATRAYGTANPVFTSTVAGAINGDTFTNNFSTTATIASPVGAYPINDTLTGPAAANYTVTVVPGTLTITKATATLTVTANNATRIFGAANPIFTGTITGALNGDTFTIAYATTATATSPIGTYPIVPTVSGAALGNYTLVVNNGALTITSSATPLTVTVNNVTRAYGAANPVFTSTIVGLLNGDTVTVTYATTATAASPVGTYAIIATVSGAATSNYILTVVPGTLTVAPAATATTLATSASPVLLGASITFTATVGSAAGVPPGTVQFLNGATLLGAATLNASGVATFTTSSLPAGTYTITATYQASTNYASSTGTVSQTIDSGAFTLKVDPPTQFIRGAGSTVYTITATSIQNFSGPITLTCAGLPGDATCAFATPTINLPAGGIATTTMTIVNTVADAQLRKPVLHLPTSLAPITVAAVFPFELTGLGVFFAGFSRRKKTLRPSRSPKMRLMLLLLCTAGIIGLAGCACFTSIYQNYTVTITGAATSSEPQSTSVILSVAQQ
jgi:sugar lactone lactonase YvrE